MRKHITQAEILRIEKCLRGGITDKAEIQKIVFVHEACIDQVINKFNNQPGNAPAEEASKPKRRSRKAAVDPLS